MELIQGGQSGIAPACDGSSPTQSAATITQGVTGPAELEVRVSRIMSPSSSLADGQSP
jgi:hypothetical protein